MVVEADGVGSLFYVISQLPWTVGSECKYGIFIFLSVVIGCHDMTDGSY